MSPLVFGNGFITPERLHIFVAKSIWIWFKPTKTKNTKKKKKKNTKTHKKNKKPNKNQKKNTKIHKKKKQNTLSSSLFFFVWVPIHQKSPRCSVPHLHQAKGRRRGLFTSCKAPRDFDASAVWIEGNQKKPLGFLVGQESCCRINC